MSFESFVASRYLRSRRGSKFLSLMTYVAVASVAIGTAALIITFTILDGFERELRTNIIGVASHIRVGIFRNATVAHDSVVYQNLIATTNVMAAQPFLERQAMLLTRDNIDGVLVKGIPGGNDISSLRKKIVKGGYTFDSSNSKPGIIMSKRMAQRLGVDVGDKVVLIDTEIQDLFQVPKVQCVIRGLYETGMAEYIDDLYVFVDIRTAQTLFAQPNHISGYDVLCTDVIQVEPTVNAIQNVLGYPFNPRSVFSIYRNLFVWIDLQQKLIPVVVGSLIFIAVFNVIATLLLFVIEKTSDIGIFVSMGASKKNIRKLFVYQGTFIGITGVLIGSAIAFVLCFIQLEFKPFSLPEGVYYMTSVPIYLRPQVFLITSLIALTLSIFSSVIPAWLGARLDPITSIRFH